MLDLNKLEEKQEDLIAELTEDKLKQYIKHLVKNFYETYISGNKKDYEATVKLLESVIKIHKFNYANLIQYIYYCLVDYSFKLFNTAFSSEFDLKHFVTSDLNNNALEEHDVLRMEYSKAIAEQEELASYIWLELTSRHEVATYNIFLDHDDRNTLKRIYKIAIDNKEDVPEDLLELIIELYENTAESNPKKKTYHNFSKYQEGIKKEIKEYHKQIDEIKAYHKKLKEENKI